jgi:hypothetical protein
MIVVELTFNIQLDSCKADAKLERVQLIQRAGETIESQRSNMTKWSVDPLLKKVEGARIRDSI